MQIAVATPKVQSYSVSQSKPVSFQPQQQLEPSVADSFTPSVVQERSGGNGKTVFRSLLTTSLLCLVACGQQVVEKVTPTIEKSVGEKLPLIIEGTEHSIPSINQYIQKNNLNRVTRKLTSAESSLISEAFICNTKKSPVTLSIQGADALADGNPTSLLLSTSQKVQNDCEGLKKDKIIQTHFQAGQPPSPAILKGTTPDGETVVSLLSYTLLENPNNGSVQMLVSSTKTPKEKIIEKVKAIDENTTIKPIKVHPTKQGADERFTPYNFQTFSGQEKESIGDQVIKASECVLQSSEGEKIYTLRFRGVGDPVETNLTEEDCLQTRSTIGFSIGTQGGLALPPNTIVRLDGNKTLELTQGPGLGNHP